MFNKKIIMFLFFIVAHNSLQALSIAQVTFPRSGYGLLREILLHYFNEIGEPLSFCCARSSSALITCHCGLSPCENNSIVRHSHDSYSREFVVYSPDERYIIQYRKNPILQFMALRRFVGQYTGEERTLAATRNSSFQEFLLTLSYKREGDCRRHFLTIWENFIEKNINKNPHPENTYFLEYYDLVERPFFHLTQILKKVFLIEKVDYKVLKQVLDQKNIRLKNNDSSSEFEYLRKSFIEVIVPVDSLNFKEIS